MAFPDLLVSALEFGHLSKYIGYSCANSILVDIFTFPLGCFNIRNSRAQGQIWMVSRIVFRICPLCHVSGLAIHGLVHKQGSFQATNILDFIYEDGNTRVECLLRPKASLVECLLSLPWNLDHQVYRATGGLSRHH